MPLKLSQEFVEKESLKKGIRIKDTYKNNKTPMISECLICLYEWRICWNNIQGGQGCPKCSGNIKHTQKFIEHEAIKRRILIKDIYKNSGTPMNFECAVCGNLWSVRWNDIQQGTGCPECSILRRAAERRLSQEFVEKESLKKGILIKDIYKNNYTPMKSECAVCGNLWSVRWNDIQKGKGCPKCSNQKSKPQEEIFEFVKTIHNDTHQSKKRILKNSLLELDVWIPSLDKAIEFDGPRHDPEHVIFNSKNRDLEKNLQCKEAGIDLLRVSYKDYTNKSNKIWILLCVKEWLSQPNSLISK